MPICKYFLQGTCIYGNKCRFDHEYTSQESYGRDYTDRKQSKYRIKYKHGNTNNYSGNSYYTDGGRNSTKSGGTSILRGKAQASSSSSLFSGNSFDISSNGSGSFSSGLTESKFVPVQRKVQETLQELKNEFKLWEHSGQWPLSCFSLYKGENSLPGFIDYSPEELRYFMYESRRMGNLPECMNIVKGMYDKAKLAREQLVTQSAEVILSRGRKIERTLDPADLGNSSATGGNEQPAPAAANVSLFSYSEPSTASNNNFSAIGTPHGGLLENACPGNIFGYMANYDNNSSIFGGIGHLPQGASILNAPSSGNGLSVGSEEEDDDDDDEMT